ncbi:MAG: SufD family Fe-S cluster assembly protein [Halobacteria archaeon]
MPEVKIKQKALAAQNKKAPIGEDINLERFKLDGSYFESINYKDLPLGYRDQAFKTGVDLEEKQRAGTFFQLDHSVICSKAQSPDVEVMSTIEALEKYEWLRDYYWRAVDVDADKYTAQAELHLNHGYFIRAKPGVKVIYPVQACLFIGTPKLAQNVHNIIIAEEESELHIITGCTTAPGVKSALHIGISEFYVKKNAKLSFTMIHNWAEEVEVRPRSGTIVEENGVFLSNYICLRPVKSLQMYPVTYLLGENSISRYNTVLYAPKGSNLDVGSRVYLKSKATKAEIIVRAITKGGNIVSRGHIVGEVPGVKAHLECRGLILGNGGIIHAIPELEGKVEGVDLSHEAAVGKIAEEQIQYLMARGLSSDEATSVIVRGFLDVDIQGLPDRLKDEIKRVIRIAEKQIL